MSEWINVRDRLPEVETEVIVLAWHGNHAVITTGVYEDGTMTTEDSIWHWEDCEFEYDEEQDSYIIPEGWWEYKHYLDDDEYNCAIDDDVTHWMPLLSPPGEEDLMPTVDAVQVVRCKDCKWWNGLGCAIYIADDSDKPKENDYCSFGERKQADE